MTILWVGHEADCYDISSASASENSKCADTGYSRAGLRVSSFETTAYVYSTPDWAATDEIYHRFNQSPDTFNAGLTIWAAVNGAGVEVAKLVTLGSTAQFQVWNGATYDNIGAAFSRLTTNTKYRCDIHFKGGAAGVVEVYFGTDGSQIKVVDATGDYSSATGIVKIKHGAFANNACYVGHEVVQTTSTLNTTSETKPPTSNGTDVGGTGTWAGVDETPWNDSDFVSFSASGNRQSFKAAARTLTAGVVKGVTASCRASYEAGGPSQIKPYLLIGGTRYYGTTFNLTLAMKGYQYTWQTNPATGAAFTIAEANAATLEWGWECV